MSNFEEGQGAGYAAATMVLLLRTLRPEIDGDKAYEILIEYFMRDGWVTLETAEEAGLRILLTIPNAFDGYEQ